MSSAAPALLTDLLRQVSRSFYLTLRVLPMAVRPQIGLAYLLARTTDTIADTEIVSVEQRLKALTDLRERILGTSTTPLQFGELAKKQGLPAERIILERVEEALALLGELSAEDLKSVRWVLDVITSGQELDLRRFSGASQQNVIALQTRGEIDDYTYRVAGCVGEFWTRICRRHLFPKAPLDDQKLLADGVSFGKGLQLVNILRDLPRDLRQGRCYLPQEKLVKIGLQPADLLNSENFTKLRPVFGDYVDQANTLLSAGWEYTNTLPWECVRVRLACAWPIIIGRRTLAKLKSANALDEKQRIKVSRAEVYGIMVGSVLTYPVPYMWRRLK